VATVVSLLVQTGVLLPLKSNVSVTNAPTCTVCALAVRANVGFGAGAICVGAVTSRHDPTMASRAAANRKRERERARPREASRGEIMRARGGGG
jgi:hypothetical protein